MIPIGSKPDLSFPIKAWMNGREVKTTFAELIRGRTVVSVYFKNGTDVCDIQNFSLRDHARAFAERGVTVVAVGRETCRAHARYAGKHALTHILVSDPDKLFAQATDSLVEKSMYGKKYMGPTRSAFLFAADGSLQGIIPQVDAPNHAQEVLALIDSTP